MEIPFAMLSLLVFAVLSFNAVSAFPVFKKSLFNFKRGHQIMSTSEASAITGLAEAKMRLREIGIKTSNGLQASTEEHANAQFLVGEIAKAAAMPTSTAEYASKMEGSWTLTYTTNREFSSGKVGPFIGKVIQRVDTANQKYYNDLSVFNGLLSATLQGTWEELGEASTTQRTWKIIFLNVVLRLFGQTVKEQSMLGNVGLWRSVYLDHDMRIFYARNFNKPDAAENVYVLSRV